MKIAAPTHNFSHSFGVTEVQILGFADRTELHKVGCQHRRRAEVIIGGDDNVLDVAELIAETVEVYRDDFYSVGPCARGGGAVPSPEPGERESE